MHGDFNENMHLLQNYQSSRVTLEEILSKAETLYFAYEQAATSPNEPRDFSTNHSSDLAQPNDVDSSVENATMADEQSEMRNRGSSKSSLSIIFRKNKKWWQHVRNRETGVAAQLS